MKILVIADEESQKIWDFFRKEDYADIDLVISCGDLKADYLSAGAAKICRCSYSNSDTLEIISKSRESTGRSLKW